jgi:hypothetical protein
VVNSSAAECYTAAEYQTQEQRNIYLENSRPMEGKLGEEVGLPLFFYDPVSSNQ